MGTVGRIWARIEDAIIVFLLAAMTLVTFFYVVFNNLYGVFFSIAEWFEEGSATSEFFYTVGDFFLDVVQSMTWSNALTKALFAWLIFFGIAYGVRVGGHIGVDALVKMGSHRTQKSIGIVACLVCIGYAVLLSAASYGWATTLLKANIGADDLGHYGIKQWHITLIVPVGFAMVFARFVEVLVRILTNQQTGLGLADEAADAMKLSSQEESQ